MLIQRGLFRLAIFATLCCFFFEDPVSSIEEIKHAYYSCMKSFHPYLSGNDADATNFCIFVNAVYEVLSDPIQCKEPLPFHIPKASRSSCAPMLRSGSSSEGIFAYLDIFSIRRALLRLLPLVCITELMVFIQKTFMLAVRFSVLELLTFNTELEIKLCTLFI
jgi:hypothetical protein